MASRNRCSFIVYFFGVLLIVGGIVLALTWPLIYYRVWKGNLQLDPSSKSFKLWVKTPMPLYMEIYLFNWTNSEEFLLDNTVKPAFDEVGPFVFREVHERVNIFWNQNDTVTYNQTRKWYFVPEKSVNLSVPITNLNVVLTVIAKAASVYGKLIQELLNILSFTYRERLIITRPASQWLFEGMNDKLLNLIRIEKPELVPFDKFGWFYDRNQSSVYDGKFNIKTGKTDIYELGMLAQWNDQSDTRFFEGECAHVGGTTSDFFPPLPPSPSNLSMFLSDFCGPLMLTYSNSTYVNGLEGYQFIGDERVFDNGTRYERGKCFCSGKCSPSGVRNETLCRGAPVFISFPHFYLADPLYVDSVIGMKPNESQHQFYIIINPMTGMPLDVRAQLQLNILLEPLEGIKLFSKIPRLYIPMMWFRQTIELPDSLVSLGASLLLLKKAGFIVGSGLIVVGVLMILIRIVRMRSKGNEEELLIPEEEKKDSEPEVTNGVLER